MFAVSMSRRYDNISPSPTNHQSHSGNYLPLSTDVNYLNYTLLESAAALEPSLTSFHLNDSNNNNNSSSSSSSFLIDRYSHLQPPQKRRYILVIFINRVSHGRVNTADRYIHKINTNMKKEHFVVVHQCGQ